MQLLKQNPKLQEPQDPILIWQNVIYTPFMFKIFVIGVCFGTYNLTATLNISAYKAV